MKLKDYIRGLQNLMDENPDAANYTVVYENGHQLFAEFDFSPSVGYHSGTDFINDTGDDEYLQETGGSNCVCLN